MTQMNGNIFDILKEPAFEKNMAHDGPFQRCTLLYLALPDCAQLYMALLCLAWSTFPQTGLNAFVYTGLNAQKL